MKINENTKASIIAEATSKPRNVRKTAEKYKLSVSTVHGWVKADKKTKKTKITVEKTDQKETITDVIIEHVAETVEILDVCGNQFTTEKLVHLLNLTKDLNEVVTKWLVKDAINRVNVPN